MTGPMYRLIAPLLVFLLAEIGNLNFLRGKQYQGLFERLDRAKGFYHERWGDAPSTFASFPTRCVKPELTCLASPVRSLALALFSNFTQTHFFEDIACTLYAHKLNPLELC